MLASALLGEDPPELPWPTWSIWPACSGSTEPGPGGPQPDGGRRGGDHRRRRPLPAGRSSARPPGPPGRQPSGGHPTVAGCVAPGGGDRLGQPAEVRSRPPPATGPGPAGRAARGVWLRPDNLDLRPDPAADPDVALFSGTPEGIRRPWPRPLWDLDGWARRAADLAAQTRGPAPERTRRPGPGVRALGRGAAPSPGRSAPARRAAAGRLAGHRLREEYDRWDRRYRQVLRRGAARPEPAIGWPRTRRRGGPMASPGSDQTLGGPRPFDGKVVVITGGARGQGRRTPWRSPDSGRTSPCATSATT